MLCVGAVAAEEAPAFTSPAMPVGGTGAPAPSLAGQADIERRLAEAGRVTLARAGVEVDTFDQFANGHRIEVLRIRRIGAASAPAVLLVPGFGRTARDYLALGVRCAQAGYTCYSVSQPGFGHSEGKADFAGPATVAALEAVLAAIRADPTVDADRVAAFGYSRGALAVASLATRDPWLAAVMVAGGIYDFASALDQVEDPRILANMLAEAGDDAEAISARSPLRHARSIAAPVLLLHGDADANAPPAQALAFEQALRALDKQVDLVMVEDAGHALPMATIQATLFGFLARQFGTATSPALPGQ